MALARGEHALPQRPQWPKLVASASSQPSAARRLQSAKPAVQVKAQASPAPQRGEAALAGVGHGSLVRPRPSGVHTLRAVAPAGQVAVPGVQTQLVQVVPLQVDDAGQATLMKLVPSALHTRTVVAPEQVELPGVQVRSAHAPAAQRWLAPQGIGVVPKPSGLQTLRVVVEAQAPEPGTHVRATQAPSRQPSPGAQATTLVESPSAAHTRRSVSDAQADDAGVHERATQAPSRHDSPAAHGIGAYPPPSAAHTRRSAVAGSQLTCPGAQRGGWHEPPRQV